jgi:MoxR-like ATPase
MNKEIKISDVPSMDVGGAVSLLTQAYIRLIEGGVPLKTMPSVMLWGPPGVGKSQAVRQIAGNLEKKTGKKCHVTDVRLLLFNPIDLRGIPTANADKTLAVWLKPQIFQMDESDDVVNILFLDEISAAPQSVQAAAYQITLDRVIGEHRLPENCIVMAAGNRVSDKSVVNKMPKALANRLMHLEIKTSVKSWTKWAESAGIHPDVVRFLKQRRDALLTEDVSSENLAYASPRTWEMVSNVLKYAEPDIDKAFQLICGLVGVNMATELKKWLDLNCQMPDMEEIFAGKCHSLPVTSDAMYATVSAMTAYAQEHKDDMDKIRNSIIYGFMMPPDFSVALLRGYLGIEKNYKLKLLRIPEFAKWMEKKGKLLNGIV